MWDDTNVELKHKPSLSHVQQLTCSLYYGGNCAKGGVHLQYCGWLGTFELWTGEVSDSEYITRARNCDGKNMLESQQEFQQSDFIERKEKPIFNMLDKGYCATQHILR